MEYSAVEEIVQEMAKKGCSAAKEDYEFPQLPRATEPQEIPKGRLDVNQWHQILSYRQGNPLRVSMPAEIAVPSNCAPSTTMKPVRNRPRVPPAALAKPLLAIDHPADRTPSPYAIAPGPKAPLAPALAILAPSAITLRPSAISVAAARRDRNPSASDTPSTNVSPTICSPRYFRG